MGNNLSVQIICVKITRIDEFFHIDLNNELDFIVIHRIINTKM